jgi:hypothetical protein
MSEWISSKERLPEDGQSVLVLLGDDYYVVAHRDKNYPTWVVTWNGHAVYDEQDEPVYWMPLPDPPKE